jgi:hypothetical protein
MSVMAFVFEALATRTTWSHTFLLVGVSKVLGLLVSSFHMAVSFCLTLLD